MEDIKNQIIYDKIISSTDIPLYIKVMDHDTKIKYDLLYEEYIKNIKNYSINHDITSEILTRLQDKGTQVQQGDSLRESYDPGEQQSCSPVVREGPLIPHFKKIDGNAIYFFKNGIRVEPLIRELDSNKRARAGGAQPLPGSYKKICEINNEITEEYDNIKQVIENYFLILKNNFQGDLLLFIAIEIVKIIGVIEQRQEYGKILTDSTIKICEKSHKNVINKINILIDKINALNILGNQKTNTTQIDLGKIMKENYSDDTLYKNLNKMFLKINKNTNGDLLLFISNEIIKLIDIIERYDEYNNIICNGQSTIKLLYDSKKVLIDQINILIIKINLLF